MHCHYFMALQNMTLLELFELNFTKIVEFFVTETNCCATNLFTENLEVSEISSAQVYSKHFFRSLI